jgi:nitrite reductase/ring-hydroxylating ferredoxin subunit
MSMPSKVQFGAIRSGYHPDPSRSHSLRAEAYTDPAWFNVDQKEILAKSWQWVCHAEKVRGPGTFTTTQIADNPIAIIRGEDRVLRAFYNVCKHRADPVLAGEGSVRRIVCPYHAWRYRLDGRLAAEHDRDARGKVALIAGSSHPAPPRAGDCVRLPDRPTGRVRKRHWVRSAPRKLSGASP